jgi:protein tyrosine phosphatase (PTP) superfamily phosphohydrolase (DUF442 family)
MRLLPLLLLSLVLGACVSTPLVAPAAPSTYLTDTYRDGALWVGGQPSDADFAALRAAGVRGVFNIRTNEEMAELPFNEPARLETLGLRYRQWPVGGAAHPYTPELLAAFAEEMAAADGQLLLHCATGGRASQLYAAWLVKYRDHTPQQAYEKLKAMNGWPLPMERLLGEPLEVKFANQLPAS